MWKLFHINYPGVTIVLSYVIMISLLDSQMRVQFVPLFLFHKILRKSNIEHSKNQDSMLDAIQRKPPGAYGSRLEK